MPGRAYSAGRSAPTPREEHGPAVWAITTLSALAARRSARK